MTRQTATQQHTPTISTLSTGNILQRKCASCGQHTVVGGECTECSKKKQVLQRRAASQGEIEEVPAIVHEVLRSPGQPLDADTRAFMEPRFNRDFSQVRVHTDTKAAESARAMNALAYTAKENIVFGSGQYTLEAVTGRKLLAHELTHTIQQQGNLSGGLQKQPDSIETGDSLEVEAEQVANKVVAMGDQDLDSVAKEPAKKSKQVTNPCDRTILAEGTCKELALRSKWVCCDPENGFERPGKKTSVAEPKKNCPSERWSPTFTCDNNCEKSLAKGCDDDDNWMAVPGEKFKLSQCGDIYTICANGKQITGYVRDKSSTETRFEVSPGIQKALGVKVGDSFLGAVYRPGAKQATIDKDSCCKSL